MPIIRSIYWDQKDNEQLVYKYPFNDLTYGSVLTVNESQEAYFFKSGTLCDCFEAGRHVISSSNIPILKNLIYLPSGGETTFTAEVWFVSLLEKRNILWGAGNLRVIDPYFQIPLKVTSRGQYGIKIFDGGLFIEKFVGTLKSSGTDSINDQFRSDIIEGVKIGIANFLKESGLNINEVCTDLRKIANYIKNSLDNTFNSYGITLTNFNIEDIGFDESDPGYLTVMKGIAENARLKSLGVNYLQERQLEIAQAAAGNEGAGAFMGVGIGLGAGQQLGNMLGSVVQNSGLGAPPPPPPSAAYYVAMNGQTTGPYSKEVLRTMVQQGQVTMSTYVYRVGGSTWILAQNDPELGTLFGLVPPPPPSAL